MHELNLQKQCNLFVKFCFILNPNVQERLYEYEYFFGGGEGVSEINNVLF